MAAESQSGDWTVFIAAVQDIIAGFQSSAPDCWPAILQVSTNITNAANRAVTHAWSIVAQREATIRALTTQLDNCLSGSDYRQSEFQACTRELAAAQATQAASARLIAQLREENGSMASALANLQQQIPQLKVQLEQKDKQVQQIPSLLKQCQDYWIAEKARQEAPLNQRIKDLGNALEISNKELTNWRDNFPTLGPLNAGNQFRNCKDELQKCHNTLAVIQPNDQQCQDKLLGCQAALKQCQDRVTVLQGQLQKCTDSIVPIQKQCQEQVTILRAQCQNQIVPLRQTILEIQRQNTTCHNEYAVLVVKYNQLNTQYRNLITTCKTPQVCKQCTTITGKPGVCTGICQEPKTAAL